MNSSCLLDHHIFLRYQRRTGVSIICIGANTLRYQNSNLDLKVHWNWNWKVVKQQGQVGSSGTLWDQAGPSGIKWGQMGPNKAIWGQTGPKKAKRGRNILMRRKYHISNPGTQTKIGRAMGILLIPRFWSGSTKMVLEFIVLFRGNCFLHHLKAYLNGFIHG